jgi:AcrR family transcriptional regulator
MEKDNYHHGDLKNALINAGIEILSQEGLQGLSLRSAAQRAGVSHSAPYSHFKDKQALIAAISTKGLDLLYKKLSQIAVQYQENPLEQLHEVAWGYTEFALENTGLFRLIFSSAIEHEHDYPDFVTISHRTFNWIVTVVENNQRAGVLKPGQARLIALTIWSMVHGFIFLHLEKQIPSNIARDYQLKSLLRTVLKNFVDINAQ